MPRVFGSVTVTESGGDTALMLGVLGNAGAELLPGEANGFGVDFMEAINFNVAVRTSSVTAAYRLDFITNTGSDPKMVYDQAGVLGYSPHNMMAWSEQLDMYPSQGGAAHCLVTPDVDTWPGGGPTADRMTAGATTELYEYRSSSVAGTVIGQTYTLSRLVKRDTWDFVWMQFPGGGDLTIFNLATGTFTLPLSGAPVTPTVDNLGGGWWRLKVTAVATVATSALASAYAPAPSTQPSQRPPGWRASSLGRCRSTGAPTPAPTCPPLPLAAPSAAGLRPGDARAAWSAVSSRRRPTVPALQQLRRRRSG